MLIIYLIKIKGLPVWAGSKRNKRRGSIGNDPYDKKSTLSDSREANDPEKKEINYKIISN